MASRREGRCATLGVLLHHSRGFTECHHGPAWGSVPSKETGTFIALWHKGVAALDFPVGANVWALLLPQCTEKGLSGVTGWRSLGAGQLGQLPCQVP